MRIRSFTSIAAGAALSALFATSASAGCNVCGQPAYDYGYQPGPRVIYTQPTYSYAPPSYVVQPNVVVQPTYVMRPTYVQRPTYLVTPQTLDPSDHPPRYIVNQGPTYTGPNITQFEQPAYSDGGYDEPHPYVSDESMYRAAAWRYGHSYRPYHHHPRWSQLYRPRASYAFRAAPNARVLAVREHRYAAMRYNFRATPKHAPSRYKVRGRWQ